MLLLLRLILILDLLCFIVHHLCIRRRFLVDSILELQEVGRNGPIAHYPILELSFEAPK